RNFSCTKLKYSGCSKRIQTVQQALDEKYGAGKYKVGTDTLNGTQGLRTVRDSNKAGVCAEPKCSVVAKEIIPALLQALLLCGVVKVIIPRVAQKGKH
ncbi:hypothetical protein QAZ01_10960, partial [Glaesserella parasuis]